MFINKMKTNTTLSRQFQNSNIKVVERDKIDISKNPGPGLEKANKCGGVNPSTLDSCISNGNTHINVKKTSLPPPFFID
jgi:hypothetical protein